MAKLGRKNKARKTRVNKALTKKQLSAVKKVANAVVRKNEETKFFNWVGNITVNGTGSGGGGVPTSYNLFSQGVTRGVGNNQLLGDKLRWKGVAVRWRLINAATIGSTLTYQSQPLIVDVMILSTNVYKTGTSLTLADIRNDTVDDYNLYYLNPSTKMIYKKTLVLKPDRGQSTVQEVLTSGKFYVKRNQMIEYQDFENTYNLKGTKNYYIMVVPRSPSGTSYMGTLSLAVQNYFTDS